MKRIPTPIAATALALTLASTAHAAIKWRGDFETGDRSQYNRIEMVSPDRLQVVPSPARQGRYALRAEVRQGDDPIDASGNRNELMKQDGASEGTEYYYGWSTLWPSDYPLTPTWQVFMQWHHPGTTGAPPVRFVLGCSAADCGEPLPDTLFLIVNNKTVWTRKGIKRGEWTDFVLHVKWSADPAVGFVELWYDGQLVLPRRYTRTLYSSSDTNYLKTGLYRDEVTQPTAVLYHDGLVQATTYEEAAPQPQGASAPTPPPEATPTPSAPTDPTEPTWPGDDGEARALGCSQGPASLASWGLGLAALALAPLLRRRRRA